jgi:Protein of unknown function (DUF3105)
MANSGKSALAETETFEDPRRKLIVLSANAAYDYGVDFPTFGTYDPDWVNTGFYTDPRSPTLLVHSLSRGYVVIYYDRPSSVVLQMLKHWASLFHEDRDGIIVVPHFGLDERIVLTSWGKRLNLSEFNQSAAAAFIDAFRGRGPEGHVR